MHAVLTYRQLLLVSFLPPTVDHPPGRAEEGEKEEEGRERWEVKKVKEEQAEHEHVD